MKLSQKFCIGFISVYILILLFFLNGSGELQFSADLQFLYNRAFQFYDNITNGRSIFFFDNDFGGVGYGSPFFYGYLTLLPFLPFVSFGFDTFIKLFIAVVIVLVYWGVDFFSSRFTENSKLISSVFMLSSFIILFILSNPMFANFYAFAFSMFFLGYCVDFFRDKKHGYEACLFFFLIMNTHIISALFSFLGCIVICLFYFDKKRFLEYCKFAILNIVLNIYTILNMLYHREALRDMSDVNAGILVSNVTDGCMSAKFPFGGVLLSILGIEQSGYKYFNLVMLILLVLAFVIRIKTKSERSKTFSWRETLSLPIILIGGILAINTIWQFIGTRINTLFQFPFRYMFYFLVIILIISLRSLDNKKVAIALLLSGIIDLILGGFCITPIPDEEKVSIPESFCVMNGEYLSDAWIWDYDNYLKMRSEVTDQYGNTYDYTREKDGSIRVTLTKPTDGLVLTFPKLYYKGYRAWGSKELSVKSGYSNFCVVDVGSELGVIVLEYKHPIWLVILFWLDIVLLFVLRFNKEFKEWITRLKMKK